MVNVKRLFHQLNGMSVVKRWNFHTRLTDQNVAEHSFYVCIFAFLLYELEKEFDRNRLDLKQILKYALLHDIEEAISGDIPFLTKRLLPMEIKNKIEGKATREILVNAPDEFLKTKLDYDKLSDINAMVVKASDFFSVIHYCEYEKELGNNSFDQIKKETVKVLRGISLNYTLESINRVLDCLGYTKPEDHANIPDTLSHL